jgi:hypothetical protein
LYARLPHPRRGMHDVHPMIMHPLIGADTEMQKFR